MTADYFSLPYLIVYAILYGVTMKLADLCDEHGLRWFPGDRLLFGLLWGVFGSLLVLSRVDIANVILAQLIAYILRLRLDFFNHALATVMILVTFLTKSVFDPTIFWFFFIGFLIFGSLRDYVGNGRQKPDWFYRLNEPAIYYFLVPLIYGLVTHTWLLLIIFTIYRLSYNLVKYGLFWAGAYQKL